MQGYSPETVYPFAVNGLLLISQIWVIVYGGKYSFTLRIVSTYFLSAIILVVIPLLARMGGAVAFWSVFLVLFVFGIVLGVQQASVFSMAGVLPFRFMGAVMLGNGIAGIACNILRAATLIIWPVGDVTKPNNQFIGALSFFLLAAVFMVVCGMCQFILKKNEYAIFHLWQNPGFKPKLEDLSPLIPQKTTSPISPLRLSRKAKPIEK